jgi:hypothetical protein
MVTGGQGGIMQNAAYGMYKDGQIVLDEPVQRSHDSRVVVVFLDEKEIKKPGLKNFFDLYGQWEDDRDVDTIIADIRSSRISKANIRL